MNELKVKGRKANILLKTMNQEKLADSHIISGLEVAALNSNSYYELPDVYTQNQMPVTCDNIPHQEELSDWPELNAVEIPVIDADVELLIGTNVPKVMEPWEVVHSRGDGPYAVRTLLGCVVNGPLRGNNEPGSTCPTISANRISIAKIEELLVKQYNSDFNEKSTEEKPEMSREDLKFMDIMNSSAELDNGHYCLRLPFREDNVTMPNNSQVAEQRALCLKRKLKKNATFKEEYSQFLCDVIKEGYAEKVPESQLERQDGKVCYIPHHGVRHPKKETLRVVFDCGASFKGMSLNSQLLQGPDLTNSLLGVLTRFRQEAVAVIADIKAMYHQVKVAKQDIDFLRFLWWSNGDLTQPLTEHRMTVHLFGAISSPSCASFALRKVADDNMADFPTDVTDTIKHNFYVDDCLKSLPSEAEATALVKHLTAVCELGGFQLVKWMSNSKSVLESIDVEKRAKEVKELDFDRDNLPVERTLGLQWCAETDTFGFKMAVQERPFTRQGILSMVSSVYDPIGFLAPFSLPIKLMMQHLCKLSYSWDDHLPENYQLQWIGWLKDLKRLSTFNVPRCIKPKGFGQLVSAQLHHFSDASEDGYGTVSYLRLKNDKEKVHLGFMLGKARVAPVKKVTIRRLELTAAVLAVRVDRMLKAELQLELENSVFWTDSTTVLKYIRNETKRFRTFVANRISVIREATVVSQWRYVDTKQNPADEASRGVTAEYLLTRSRWIYGPDFLFKSEREWPINIVDSDSVSITSDDPEVRGEATVNTVVVKDAPKATDTVLSQDGQNATNRLIAYFSSWRRLKTSVAWFLRVRNTMQLLNQKRKEIQASVLNSGLGITQQKKKKEEEMQRFRATLRNQTLSPEDVDAAERAIIRYCQQDKFSDEIAALKKGTSGVKKSSHLYKLDPVLRNGLLRVGGRLSKAAMSDEIKHPVILAKEQHISTLILRHIHEKLRHCGRNHLLSRLRQQYWITSANAAARKIISSCVVCRRHRGKLGEQKMADLPKERLQPDNPPFTNVGVDYCGCGPFEVKRGRSLIKRCVIFTCMASRAVHLEMAYSLDTSSCINALRRFISRRGQVTHIRSDNGTNFVGAERELREALSALNQKKIQNTLLQSGIKWSFNTPAASHHGGVWERIIRMVRKVLNSVLHQQSVDDEGLQTFLCEVEAILNDRPITKISDDPHDLEPLTPNHILLMKGKPALPPGASCTKLAYAQKSCVRHFSRKRSDVQRLT